MEHIPMSEGVIAAIIGAVATMITAFVQFTVNMRKVSSESRARRKTPWLLIFALMLTSAVGGFAYAEYRNLGREDKTEQLRAEVSKLTQLAALTGQPRVMGDANPFAGSATVPVPTGAAATPASEHMREAIIGLPACRGLPVGLGAERMKCAEGDALRVAVCVPVPAHAQVRSVELFARSEDSQQPWAASRVTPEVPASNGRPDEKYTERAEQDGSRQVCQGFAHWDSDKGRSVRVVVRYGA